MFLTGKRSPFLGEMKNSVVKLSSTNTTTATPRRLQCRKSQKAIFMTREVVLRKGGYRGQARSTTMPFAV